MAILKFESSLRRIGQLERTLSAFEGPMDKLTVDDVTMSDQVRLSVEDCEEAVQKLDAHLKKCGAVKTDRIRLVANSALYPFRKGLLRNRTNTWTDSRRIWTPSSKVCNFPGDDVITRDFPEGVRDSIAERRWKGKEQLQILICSYLAEQGCLWANIAEAGVFSGDVNYKYNDLYIRESQSTWDELWQDYHEALLTALDQLLSAGLQLALPVLRILTFEKLGIRHTCHDFLLIQKCGTSNQDKSLIAQLEELMQQFKSRYAEHEETFKSFFDHYWKPHMDKILADMNGSDIDEDQT
ncbi:hypothetical protein BCR34DRAFT_607689 [Clohesyomyces aquaticus]|uniref:Uncharacterized protein n=1 Tax=Clohesyomyces aquaticus TaxID=1231657 RepID=A0A1Y1YE59_9PLEO|nr:hypothetical protein BCR34DRAFT_607689 [Clohesyomyces aquaticus]